MKPNIPEEQHDQATALRQQAEEALRGKSVDLGGLSTNDIQYLLHELQVHQVELSLQNEELRRVQFDLEISRDLYSDLYDFAPAGYCTLSQKGRILNANQTLGDILGIEQGLLLHHPLSEYVDSASQDEYYLHIQKTLKNRVRAVSEIRFVKSTSERIILRMESMRSKRDPTELMAMLSDVTEQRRLENQQQENAARTVLQHKLIEQTEMERGELARNLHDGPIQRLAGLGFSVQILKEILKEHGIVEDVYVQQMGEDIKDLIAELRSISNNLRPPVLTKLGLRRAIAEHVEELQTKYPQTKINLELSEDPARLPDPIALALYRILQQGLNNIFQHSQANEVWIRLTLDQAWILFELQDNGIGIPGEIDWDGYLREGHLGLVGMKERAQAVGGTLQLVSQSGKGTTVKVMVPLTVNNL